MTQVRFSPCLVLLLLFLPGHALKAQVALPPDGEGVSVAVLFEIQPGPILSTPAPLPVPVLPGSTVRFTAGGLPSDQIRDIAWSKNAVELGAHGNELTLVGVKESDTGRYVLTVTTVGGDVLNAARVLHVFPFPPQRLLNLSTRALVSAAGPTVIAGFVVDAGPGDAASSKQLLIRAVGPSLRDYGVEDALPDPTLTLFRADGTQIEVSDRIRDPEVMADAVRLTGASPLRPGALDAGLLISLRGGVYTAHVNSSSHQTGEALVEIYEVPR